MATNFSSLATVEVIAKADEAALTALTQMNLKSISQCNQAQRLQVAEAMVGAIARELGTDANDAKSRFKQLCSNKCDVASPALCAAEGA